MWDANSFITKLSSAVSNVSSDINIQRGNVNGCLLVGLKANIDSYICYYLIAKDSAKFYYPYAYYTSYNEIDVSNNNLDEAISFAIDLLKRKYKKRWNMSAYKKFALMLTKRSSNSELIDEFKEYSEIPDNAFKLLKQFVESNISLDKFFDEHEKDFHVPGEPVITTKKESTCTREGVCVKTVYCLNCSQIISYEKLIIPKKPHVPDGIAQRVAGATKGTVHIKKYCKICHELISDEIAKEVFNTTREQNEEKQNTPVIIDNKPKKVDTFITYVNDAYKTKQLDDIVKIASTLKDGIKVGKDEYLAKRIFDFAYKITDEDLKELKAGKKLILTHPNDNVGINNVNNIDLELSKERLHLENVLKILEKEIDNLKKRLKHVSRYATADSYEERMDLMYDKYANEFKLAEISNVEKIWEKPYFARMDYLAPDKKTIYIGEDVFIDHENNDNNIHSIWSDFGRAYREYQIRDIVIKGNEVKVTKRRRFAIENHHLIDFDDIFNDDVEGDAKKGSKDSSNQVQITDPFLIYILKQKRKEKNITNIIRTIQSNQNDIIEEKIDSNIVVQGCAGSGKTMILLHRLANLKFNNPNYDWTNVRIITPNREFSFYLDELSTDLKINSIPKMTLTGYYVELVKKYQMFYLPNSNFDEQVAIRNVLEDYEWDEDIVSYIYSMSFREDMEHEWDVITNVRNNRKQMKFSNIMEIFEKTFNQMIKRKFDSYLAKDFKQYRAIYYAKVLFLSMIFGPLARVTNMLCIDEGQDISYSQYLLIKEVNDKKCCFNVFGDMNQKINHNCNLDSWDSLKHCFDLNSYSLNENYRNSVEIVNYYNSRLSVNDNPFGISVRDVRQFVVAELEALIQLQLLLENRVVIITNEKDKVPQVIMKYCIDNKIEIAKVSLMNVREVKGLEFDTAIVFDKDMKANEKYISYTRALSELYTESFNGKQMKTFDIKDI